MLRLRLALPFCLHELAACDSSIGSCNNLDRVAASIDYAISSDVLMLCTVLMDLLTETQ